MKEFLVIAACIAQKGCSESFTEYKRRTPEFVEFINRTEKDLQNHIPDVMLQTVGPTLLLLSGRSAVFVLSHGKHLVLSKNSVGVEISL